ncbi:hypothetical protein CR513_09247, partial [Mucuna pruriens]
MTPMPNATIMLRQLGTQSKNEANPNINNNPLPEHGNPTIGAICEEDHLIDEAKKVKIPMKFILKQLAQQGMIPTKEHRENYPGGTKVKRMLQSLMDKGLVQVRRKDDEVVIVHQEEPFPYKNSKAVPWRYDVEVRTKSLSITNIARIGGITRSGRIYIPESLRKENPTKTTTNFGNKENSKGKRT